MSKRLAELRHKRNQLVTQARSLLDRADTEKRGLTSDEDQQYTKLFADAEQLRSDIEREERQIEMERQVAGQAAPKDVEGGGQRAKTPRGTDEYRTAFAQYLMHGLRGMSPDHLRALAADNSPGGGFLVASEQFVADLLKGVDDEVFVRRYATVIPLQRAATLGAPTLEADPADADWTSEIATGGEDSAMSFGKREMSPSPLAKRIKVSNKLINNAALTIEQLVQQRLAYKFGIAQEKAFLLGAGANQPLGVFIAHNAGIPTSRDVSNGNTSTAITFDGLISAKYALKSQHQKQARWLFHRDGIGAIAKLKDTTNQYLWNPSRKEGEPDMLLGLPVDQSEYVPNTFTTGKYVGVLANWQHYWIAESLDFQVQVLKELYAETNQTGFIGRQELDGAPVLPEAFARVKLA